MQKIMYVEGMMCAHCEARVRKALEALINAGALDTFGEGRTESQRRARNRNAVRSRLRRRADARRDRGRLHSPEHRVTGHQT